MNMEALVRLVLIVLKALVTLLEEVRDHLWPSNE